MQRHHPADKTRMVFLTKPVRTREEKFRPSNGGADPAVARQKNWRRCAVDSAGRAAKRNTARMSDQLPIFHVLGFTGHRQLQDERAIERVMGEILAGLRSESGAEWLALSSVAAGSDLLFARSALAQGMGWE